MKVVGFFECDHTLLDYLLKVPGLKISDIEGTEERKDRKTKSPGHARLKFNGSSRSSEFTRLLFSSYQVGVIFHRGDPAVIDAVRRSGLKKSSLSSILSALKREGKLELMGGKSGKYKMVNNEWTWDK